MSHSVLEFVNRDGNKIYGNEWTIDNAKGAIVIVHGMSEYSFRYEEFAKFLNGNGYDVYALDHLGHGLNCKDIKSLGKWPKNGFNKCVDNFVDLIDDLQKKGKEVYVFSHSMGSFMGQSFMERYPGKVKKIVLCGSSGPQFIHKAGKILVSLHVLGKNKDKPSNFINNIAFGSYLARIKPKKKNAWLSYNEENVDKYNDDPYCGFVQSRGFFKSFMADGISSATSKKNMKKIDKNQEILLIAGQEDPVGNYGKAVEKLNVMYQKLGLKSQLKIYPKMRHEILNENKKLGVMNDILVFFDK